MRTARAAMNRRMNKRWSAPGYFVDFISVRLVWRARADVKRTAWSQLESTRL